MIETDDIVIVQGDSLTKMQRELAEARRKIASLEAELNESANKVWQMRLRARAILAIAEGRA